MTATNIPVVYEQTETALVEAAKAAKGLKIRDVNDREGYAAVHKHRMLLRSLRTAIENKRKDLKADALEYGRTVDKEAKRLTEIVEPTERELQAEQDRIDAEKERIRAEAEAARKAKLDERVLAFTSLGYAISASALQDMGDEEYAEVLKTAQAEHAKRVELERAEAERVAAERAEQEARDAEARRLAAERVEADRAEQRRIAEEQRVEREKLAAERKALDDERAAIERAKAPAAAAPVVEKIVPPVPPAPVTASEVVMDEASRIRRDVEFAMKRANNRWDEWGSRACWVRDLLNAALEPDAAERTRLKAKAEQNQGSYDGEDD